MQDLRSEIERAAREWLETLSKWGCTRAMMPSETTEIGRAIQREGFDFVMLALKGAREEHPNGDFNPGDYLSLKRIFKPENFGRFVNLGAKAKNKAAEMRGPALQVVPDGVEMTPEARDLLRGIGLIKGGV